MTADYPPTLSQNLHRRSAAHTPDLGFGAGEPIILACAQADRYRDLVSAVAGVGQNRTVELEPAAASNVTRPFAMTLVDPTSAAGQAIIRRFFMDIVGRYWGREATDVEVEQAMLDEPSDDLRGDTGFLVIVRDGERVVGCGGAKVVEPGVAELTRVFVDASTRGRGAGRALVSEIETMSAQRGLHTLRLTVRDDLAEAHRLYRQLGYKPVAPFSTSPYADHQLAKVLLKSR